MVLFDGFAPAMTDGVATPALDRIRREGVSSRHLVPDFPSVSMINHTGFATGCLAKHHGILSNRFLDPVRGEYKGARDADWRLSCESIFEAAERQGLKAAALGITGDRSTSRGPRASIVSAIDDGEGPPQDDARLKEVLDVLALPAGQRPALVVAYFREPDNTAHYHGVHGKETKDAVARVDARVGALMAAIEAWPPGEEGALVIGTDHGMTDVDTLINIARVMRRADIAGRAVSGGTTSFIYLDNPADLARATAALSGNAAFDVYPKTGFPPYADLGSSARVPDLLLAAKPGVWVEDPDIFPAYAHLLGITRIWPLAFKPPFGGLKASHGYDPAMPDMHGVFFAWGDGIARGREIASLRVVDLHPTVAKLLGISPGTPLDGQVVSDVLATPGPTR